MSSRQQGSPPEPIRLAVVDDSSFMRRALPRMLAEDPRIEVVGTAASGEELLASLGLWQPDVITLDLVMHGMGGLPTLDRVMAERPTPVIILSTHSGQGAPQTIEALHRGAIDFIDKQRYSLLDFASLREVLTEKILSVVGRAGDSAREGGQEGTDERVPELEALGAQQPTGPWEIVLLGASTGGPPAIQQVLEALGDVLPVPLVIAQHMPPGFTRAFAGRLNNRLPVHVQEAAHDEVLLPGSVYIAPAACDLVITGRQGRLRARVVEGRGGFTPLPSVDRLFSSAAACIGERAVAVLLTGMGRDGAAGMVDLHRQGAWTIAQDEATSLVASMPRAAQEAGATREVLPLERIGPYVKRLLLAE